MPKFMLGGLAANLPQDFVQKYRIHPNQVIIIAPHRFTILIGDSSLLPKQFQKMFNLRCTASCFDVFCSSEHESSHIITYPHSWRFPLDRKTTINKPSIELEHIRTNENYPSPSVRLQMTQKSHGHGMPWPR